MQLGELLRSAHVAVEVAADADLAVDVRAVVADSRKVAPGTLFVATSGARHRGVDFLAAAVQAGAVAVVVDEALVEIDLPVGFPVLRVSQARAAIGPLAAALYRHPTRHLQVVGITGTNGKTTTTVLVAQLLQAAGFKAAAIGTLGVWTAEGVRPGALTTPEAADLQALFAGMRDEGFTHVAMEVSSHALEQHRVDGVQFACGVWTNLSHDHLDYHGTLQAYGAAKSRLFREHLGQDKAAAFVNGDNDFSAMMWHEGLAQAWSLGRQPAAEHQVRDLHIGPGGLSFILSSQGMPDLPLQAPMVGRFNAENLVAAVLACRSLGIADATLQAGSRMLQAPRGRLEPVANTLGALVVVDYAHTPDALEKVLDALRPLVADGGRLVAVFGCGGDRDREKRPVMGRLAAGLADLVVATSDNPRSEQPEAILADVEAGMRETAVRLERLVPSSLAGLEGRHGYLIEADREQAIRRAIAVLQHGDVLVIAGKGHETTQTLGQDVRPFDDAQVAARWLLQHRTDTAARIVAARVAKTQRPAGFAFDGATALSAAGGKLLAGGDAGWSTALCTDSRAFQAEGGAPGALFVALKGDRFDGGEFVGEAIAQGAAGVVCARGRGTEHVAAALAKGAFLLEVDDPMTALGDLALDHRKRFDPLVVGVTGSNGKTTTKELIGLALGHLGATLVTHGNFNNRVGVPLTLARLTADHRAAVIEMGMSEPGEIAELARQALPRIGIVISLAEAHLQGLGSLAAIATEKSALLRAIPDNGVAVVPAAEALLQSVVASLRCRVIRFGASTDAHLGGDVRLAGPIQTLDLTQQFRANVGGTRVEVRIPGLGVHLVHNALGALAVAWAAGADLQAAAEALSRYVPVGQRMLPSRIGPWLVLEDCYNANPRSTEVALDTLATLPGPRVAVLGSMLELGPTEQELHRRVGRHAALLGLDLLISVGPFAADYAAGALAQGLATEAVHRVADAGSAAALVRDLCPGGGTVLVKGSRGARMERVVADLRSLAGQAHDGQHASGRS